MQIETSIRFRVKLGRRDGAASEFPVARFPLASERDPERQRDQAHVEKKALTVEIETVVPELVASSDVARREDLRDAGEAGPHEASLLVAGHVLQCLEAPVAERLDLARPEGARADEAHVAD